MLRGTDLDGDEDSIETALAICAIGTAVLALTAAMTAILVDVANWPYAVLLLVAGGVVYTYGWTVGIEQSESDLAE